MYIVEITNGETTTTIHGLKTKLNSGKIIKGINTIDSFTFTMFPDNPGFSLINEFSTHVTAYNTNKERYDFRGRVLYAETTMDESGKITKTVTCESIFGYLWDSVQTYVDPQNWTVAGLLQHLIDCHNSQVEAYKQFKVGNITQTETNDNIYIGVQRESTWDAIRTKLIDQIGGEIQCRVEEDGIYIDYLERIGEVKSTEIALSVNMKSITREQDPTSYVTRLIPLGCKLTDENGEETEQRLDITSVTDGGVNYIEDSNAIALYGVHTKIVEWDDITDPALLLLRGQQWMDENNRVNVKYTVTAVDLSLLGLVVDDFGIGNTHPVKNRLIGVDDTARIIKVSIDVCEEVKSSFEVGDNIKSLSDIQRDQSEQLKASQENLKNLHASVANQKMSTDQKIDNKGKEITEAYTQDIILATDELREIFTTEIQQLSDSIKLEVSGSLGSKANIILSAGGNKYSYEMDMSQVRKAFANDSTAVSISAGLITFNAGTLIVNSTNFTLDREGHITANDATIKGSVITLDGKYKTEMDMGSLRLYFDDVLCGTINTKYWSGAATEGISLRVEEGGKYIMFSHADDTQGSGYVVDYYLNGGWSSNYEEMHIFQTSARFLDDAYFAGKTRIRSLRLFGADGEYLVGINSSGGLSISKL